jgi:hypothetical protein
VDGYCFKNMDLYCFKNVDGYCFKMWMDVAKMWMDIVLKCGRILFKKSGWIFYYTNQSINTTIS